MKFSIIDIENTKTQQKIAVIILLLIVTTSCLSMKLSPFWNGQIPRHCRQYEIMADSLLEGHLYMDYDDVDPALGELDNPYDPVERQESNVKFHWDHAYYNGHYYMYFGIVPVIFVFIPFKLITGMSLTTYHATQLFTALYIVGVFALFTQLRKLFFRKLPFSMTLLLASTSSVMSTWYIDSAPALYCTAISAGICCEIWSFFFFIKAVWAEERENYQILWAFWGSLFGALAFGCRPPIALANLVVIAFLIEYLRGKVSSKSINVKLFAKLIIAASPYVVVGALLMAYNFARFDNVFEFGQSYQLTFADQHLYEHLFQNFDLGTTLNFFYFFFVGYKDYFFGVAVQFPLLWSCFLIFEKRVRKYLSSFHFALTTLFLGVAVLIIVFFESLTAPFFLPRYAMDILWLCGLMVFCVVSALLCSLEGIKLVLAKKWTVSLCVLAMFISVILFFVPYDYNFTAYCLGIY